MSQQFRVRHFRHTTLFGTIALLLLMTFAAAPVTANLPRAALLDMLRVQVTEAFKKRNNGGMVSAVDRYRVAGGTPRGRSAFVSDLRESKKQ